MVRIKRPTAKKIQFEPLLFRTPILILTVIIISLWFRSRVDPLGNVSLRSTRSISSTINRDSNAKGDVRSLSLGDAAITTTTSLSKVNEALAQLSNYANVSDKHGIFDVPMFFHVPKAGGSTVKDILGSCYRFVMATEFGITDGHIRDRELAIVYPRILDAPPGQERSPFVNVNTYTIDGIERARQMGFADSGLADIAVTNFIYESNVLFTNHAKGRLFTVVRNPIDRAISMFHYLQVATWEKSYNPELKGWTLEQYAISNLVEQDWLTKQLSHANPDEILTEDHLEIAMEILRTKFIVGLLSKMDESIERFEKIFQWKYRVDPTTQEKCRERLLSDGGSNHNTINISDQSHHEQASSEVTTLLESKNRYDIKLYKYIETLFDEQAQLVEGIPDGFRNIDATCCRCTPPTYPPKGTFTCPVQVFN